MLKCIIFSKIGIEKRKLTMIHLAFIWMIGLLIGMAAANSSINFLIPLMRSAAATPVSFFGLLAAIMLPYLFCAYAVVCFRALLTVFFVCKGFAFGFCTYGVSAAFGSAGWLVRSMFLFSDILTTLLLFFFLTYQFSSDHRFCLRTFVGCLSASLLVGGIDYCFISPFLVKLLS